MPASPLVKIHEDRIARLEEDVTECRVDLGVIKTQLTDGVAMLSDKLDAVASIEDRVAVLETNARIDQEVDEQTHARRLRRLKVVGILFGAAAAAAGVVAKVIFGG